MQQVTNPESGASKSDSTFEWSMDRTDFVSSLVIIGSTPGSDDIYAGTEIPKEHGTIDNNVTHPQDDGIYYARVKRGGSGNSDSMISGSLASPRPPTGGHRKERGNEADETKSWSDL